MLAMWLSFTMSISIHAPHEGERRKAQPERQWQPIFQSTLPTRGSDDADGNDIVKDVAVFQSTLPTRGSDVYGQHIQILSGRISIHAPHEGERLLIVPSGNGCGLFQSTLPTRGSDAVSAWSASTLWISIHAPHEGERLMRLIEDTPAWQFQSTLPTRGSDCARYAVG